MLNMKAINNWVFVTRDDAESERDGIEISDGAKVSSLYGTVSFIDPSVEFAKVGDRVHIPHYGVQDVEVEGKQYAMFKAERLFFVNGDPVNKYVLVRKCENDHIRDESGKVALYMTENNIETTNWVEVLDFSKNCFGIKEEYKGLFTPLPENDERLARIGASKDFCVHEDLIQFLTAD
jgi:co-chaperonin GroES (HSP10)